MCGGAAAPTERQQSLRLPMACRQGTLCATSKRSLSAANGPLLASNTCAARSAAAPPDPQHMHTHESRCSAVRRACGQRVGRAAGSRSRERGSERPTHRILRRETGTQSRGSEGYWCTAIERALRACVLARLRCVWCARIGRECQLGRAGGRVCVWAQEVLDRKVWCVTSSIGIACWPTSYVASPSSFFAFFFAFFSARRSCSPSDSCLLASAAARCFDFTLRFTFSFARASPARPDDTTRCDMMRHDAIQSCS